MCVDCTIASMRRKIPSTGWLTAFEAAARHQSHKSRRRTGADARRGVPADRRVGGFPRCAVVSPGPARRCATDAGRRYGQSVVLRLSEVERDTVELMSRGAERGVIERAVVPTFGTRWLISRLPDFPEPPPRGSRVNLLAQSRPFLFDGTNFDAAIYAGEAQWPGTGKGCVAHGREPGSGLQARPYCAGPCAKPTGASKSTRRSKALGPMCGASGLRPRALAESKAT